ncbi:hypothetical protein EJV47_27310 [Hymenobacter gummosus]|uniref:Uncharacterized protein n=1 Tax=Hymenobacter gummosus TaxID=1776032 RepID=A0A3S0H1P0_9BACT|nr:hypothetical protein [Hymenobacter gummosus]RTQ44704.1 hypothetical protein EJV47_27310 [Hymenobacter gummosus]
MNLYQYFCFSSFLLISLASNAQKQTKCSYGIDEYVILTDRNLDNFIQKLKTDSFTIHTDKKEIPKPVLRQLICLNDNDKHFIANPDEYYQKTDIKIRRISPTRQLIYLAKSNDMIVMTYKRGGWGGPNTYLSYLTKMGLSIYGLGLGKAH